MPSCFGMSSRSLHVPSVYRLEAVIFEKAGVALRPPLVHPAAAAQSWQKQAQAISRCYLPWWSIMFLVLSIFGAPIRLRVFRVFVFRYGCKGPGLMWDKGNGCHVMSCCIASGSYQRRVLLLSSAHRFTICFSRSPIGGSGVAGHNPHSNRFYFSLCFSFRCSCFLNVFRVLFFVNQQWWIHKNVAFPKLSSADADTSQ